MATSPRVKSEQAKGERELAEILGEVEAEALFENRRKRDGDKAHITIANPGDAKKAVANLAAQKSVSKGEAERQIKELSLAGAPDNFRVKGLGKAESGGKVAYFLVVDWPGGREFRNIIGLDAGGQDFHITLGFGPEGDVHGVRKDRIMNASKLAMKQTSLRSKLIRLARENPSLRESFLPLLKQAATGNAVFDVAQELRGEHEFVQDDNVFYYEYENLVAEAVKDAIRRFQGAGFLDFAEEDGVLIGSRPGGIEVEAYFDSSEDAGRPWTSVDVEVYDPTMRSAAWGMGPMPRSSYIPKNEPTLARAPGLPEGLEVYTYEKANARGQVVYYGVAFAGKAQKPLWNYAFRDGNQRDKQISETTRSIESQIKAKQQRSEERKQFTHGLQVGDILYSSWGYDQTNVNWYEVVGVPTEKMILVREIEGRTLRSDGYGSDEVIPAPGKYIGQVLKKIPTGRAGHISVKIDNVQTAWKWDGKPQRETSSGYGH